MHFFPESSLLNTINIPSFSDPVRIERSLSDLQLESNAQGSPNTIFLKGEKGILNPYINISKYDAESRDWFWYDADNFPHRLVVDTSDYYFYSIYGLSEHGGTFRTSSIRLSYDKDKKLPYLLASNGTISQRFYKFQPIVVTVQGRLLTDQTDYFTFKINNNLTRVNVSQNPEFFFDFENRIITNQTLTGFDPLDVKVYFFNNINNVSVKCRLGSNTGAFSYGTPTVDYYILKLRGQMLRTQ